MTTVLTVLQLIARADAEGSYTFHAEIVEGLGEGDHPSNNGVEWQRRGVAFHGDPLSRSAARSGFSP